MSYPQPPQNILLSSQPLQPQNIVLSTQQSQQLQQSQQFQQPQAIVVSTQPSGPVQTCNDYYIKASQPQENVQVVVPNSTEKVKNYPKQRKICLILFIVGFIVPLTWVAIVLSKLASKDTYLKLLASYSLSGILLYIIFFLSYVIYIN